MRSATLLAAVLAVFAPRWSEGAASAEPSAKPEAVVLLLAGPLREGRLASFLQAQPGRYLATSTLQRACLTSAVQANSLLMFFAESQRCEQIGEADKLLLGQRLQAVTGSYPPTDFQARLQEHSFLALPAARRSSELRALKCFCASNAAPQGVVSCDVQTRTAASRIASIDYLASDADGDPLEGEFTHQRDADPVQNGLPAPLTSSCVADLGTLQCTVSGNAPDQAGDLQLMLAVSDGAASLQLSSLLEITATNGDQLFIDSFETPVCP